ncbi:hypothetical protein [Pseudomonas sp. CBC3]|uniref:hypothetical protein n=1 Tax=Pseudomonas sp. CBC3 TaxID=3123318 RepID=UPI0030EA9941
MLSAALATWILAAAPSPVDAQLELTPDGSGRVSLRLCFISQQPHQLRYQLEVMSTGTAGTNRSRQAGELVSGSNRQCPLSNRVSVSENGRLEAVLNWSIDGQPQAPIQRSYPTTAPASPQPQSTPPGTAPGQTEAQVASARPMDDRSDLQ